MVSPKRKTRGTVKPKNWTPLLQSTCREHEGRAAREAGGGVWPYKLTGPSSSGVLTLSPDPQLPPPIQFPQTIFRGCTITLNFLRKDPHSMDKKEMF